MDHRPRSGLLEQFAGVDRVASYGTGYNYTLKSQTKSAAARQLSFTLAAIRQNEYARII